jgi:hypothetical protein
MAAAKEAATHRAFGFLSHLHSVIYIINFPLVLSSRVPMAWNISKSQWWASSTIAQGHATIFDLNYKTPPIRSCRRWLMMHKPGTIYYGAQAANWNLPSVLSTPSSSNLFQMDPHVLFPLDYPTP